MGYQMFTGPRLERLVEAHLPLFDAGFFGPRPLIVLQNQSLAQWLKLFLARAKGGYATGDFVFQDELLRRLIAGAGTGGQSGRVLFIDDLKFELYRHLSRGADPALAAVLRGGSDPGRLFELADHLAGVFHSYAMNSTLWPPALTAGLLPAGTGADPETFAWQTALWCQLLTSQTLAGLELERLTRDPPPVTGEPRRVVIVGSAFLSRRAAAFLSAWAEYGLIDVVHLLLLPSALPAAAWPEKRPWSSWGSFGRAFLEALPVPDSGSRPEGTTALANLQRSLAVGEAFAGRPDGTLEVVSAPHPLRELEAVRDRLLAALAADPTLEVSDMAVLAPDINVYAPFLDAAFSSDELGRRLNFHVIDLDLGRENAWFRALDALLALISGPVDRPALFALVDAAPFREAWKLEDEERSLWLEYTETVSAWREGPPGEPQSWSASWPRLFEGWFREDADALVPPLTMPPSAFQTLGRFHELLERLGALSADARRPRGFLDWVRFLDVASALFLTEDETGSALSGRLRTLADASTDFTLPWAGFRSFVQDQIAHFPGRRGQLLTEGLHCSSLRPLRAIPFRVVAVLGLNEGAFPRRDPSPSFDLARYEEGHDALSAPALDRYCFWETIMAARDLLYLSYQGRSAVDGTDRPASSVLSDLLDYLETVEGGTSVAWPVAEISVKDFSAEGGITWSPRSVRRAEAVAKSRTARREPLPMPALSEGEDPFAEVTSDDVVRAFTVPARFHLERVRQIRLREEDARGVEDEEPWSVSFLEKHSWLAEGVEEELGGGQAQDAGARVARAVALGQAREGVFANRDRRELKQRSIQASEWARELHDEGWQRTKPSRTRWAGRPWTGGEGWERDGTLLVPLLLYGHDLPGRNKFAAALQVLQRGANSALLSTLNPSGERRDRTWNRDLDVAALAKTAQDYWNEAASRPLPFYPDLLERLARRLDDGMTMAEGLPAAWNEALDTRFGTSSQTFGRCPYARLVFADEPDWPAVAADCERWWVPLFRPLLRAWT